MEYKANSMFDAIQIENKIIRDAIEKAKGNTFEDGDKIDIEKSFKMVDATRYELKYKGKKLLDVTFISNNGKYIIETK